MTEQKEVQEQTEKVKNSPFRLLKNRDFTSLFIGGFISNVGSWFTMVGVIFLALEITSNLTEKESTQAVALLTTFSLIPILFLGPIGGVLADKFDRKKIMFFADLLGATAATALIFATQMWQLYLFMVLNSSVRQFFYPARTASLPMIIKKEQLLSANGFIQTTNQISRMIGPLLAGFLTAAFGLQVAFVVDAVSYVLSAIMIIVIRTNLKPEESKERVTMKGVFVGMKEGAKITFTDGIIGFVVITFGVTMLAIGAIDPVAVPYLNFEFGLGEDAFGMLMSVSAVSGIIAAVILSIKGKLKNKLTFMSIAILALGSSVAILSFAPIVPSPVVWLYLGMSLIGFTNVGFAIPFSTLLQTIVKNEQLGRVSGIIDTIMTLASFLASLLATALVGVVSISILLAIVAGIVLVSGIIFLIVVKVRKLETVAQRRENEMIEEVIEDSKDTLVEFDEIQEVSPQVTI